MPNPCTICSSPHAEALNSRLASGESGRSLAAELGLSLAAVYRHIRSGHHARSLQPPSVAPGTPNASPNAPALSPSISATLRDVQRLAREAQRHLKDARKAGDHKATNGAITAAAKALELVGKLRGELQHGATVNVGISVEAKTALDLQSHASSMDAGDVTREAFDWLAARIEAGDADARSTVLALVRLLPDAAIPEGGSAAEGDPRSASAAP